MVDKKAFAILATDISVLTVNGGELKVLLTIAKSEDFKGMSVLPGGLVKHSERTEDAAKRILTTVLTSTDFYLEQLFTFDDPRRDPVGRVVSVGYVMIIPWNQASKIIKNNASWQSVKNLPKLAYDHNEIVKAAVKRLKGKLTYTNIVFSLMPSEFTFTDLQKVYESVLETSLDKRNFVKKIKSLGLLTKTGQKVEGNAHRPASLYRFTSRKYIAVDVF